MDRQPDIANPKLSELLNCRLAHTPLGPIEYVEFGEGPAVVVIHGAMGGYDQSVILAQTIGAAGYRYIAISRPGYLGTPMKSGRTPEQQGDLIAALLDELGIDRAGVMAVSGGGPSAIEFALRHSSKCAGLILVSTHADNAEVPIPASFKIMKLLARLSWFARRFRKKAERDLRAVAGRSIQDKDILQRTVNDAETWPLFSTMLLSTFNQMGKRIAGTENDIKISRTASYPLEELTVPVLVVHGTADRLVPFDKNAGTYEARVPNVEILAVEGGEHVSIFTHRNIVRPKVEEFIRKYFAA
ncbi:MAG TPA: alpha/beta hydrolase [candidate division Zixibacteria bacterium]|nr:alpha/beta hydrolase [candidate division Zixibacteria bacterium]